MLIIIITIVISRIPLFLSFLSPSALLSSPLPPPLLEFILSYPPSPIHENQSSTPPKYPSPKPIPPPHCPDEAFLASAIKFSRR